jgi:NADH-quinone oxidoreductase subunit N
MESQFDYQLAMPTISVALFGLFVMLAVPVLRLRSGGYAALSLTGIVVASISNGVLWTRWLNDGPRETAHGMIVMDGFGLFFSFLLLVITGLSVVASIRFLQREQADHGEFYALMLFCVAGMLIMINTRHLMMILIGLEVFSVSMYVMTGLTRNRARSVESALKYFLLGAFSSGFLVYGMALIYGSAGSLNLPEIARYAAGDPGKLFFAGIGLLLIGLLFKIAVFPFHQWVPDVYQGAPTNVTGYMAAATKTAAFAVLLRVLIGAFGTHTDVWIPLITWLSILTMTVANLVALTQNNVKRMLAFSSVAHAGYLLIALVCINADGDSIGVGPILFYLTAYAFMTVGAFAVAAAVGRGDERGEEGYDLYSWSGLGWRKPALGVAMTVFLMSLAGIPPTGGFFGKYAIFQAAIRSEHYALAVIGMLNAVVAAYYYLRVVVAMYLREAEDEPPAIAAVSPTLAVVLVVTVAGVLFLGFSPGDLLDLANELGHSITFAF